MIRRTEPSSADLWVVRIAIALVVVFVILCVAGFNVLKRTGAWDRLLHPAQRARRSEVSVLHGSIVQPAELHAWGSSISSLWVGRLSRHNRWRITTIRNSIYTLRSFLRCNSTPWPASRHASNALPKRWCST